MPDHGNTHAERLANGAVAEGGRRKDVVHVELAGVEVLGHGELGVDAVLEKHLQPRRRPLVIPGNTTTPVTS